MTSAPSAAPRRWSADDVSDRPYPPAKGAGRLLRILAGVDESVLDRVPSERPRYTALGGVVLGTAAIAAFSMFNAVRQVIGDVRWWVPLVALGWGAFIANLDRWLISTSVGAEWRAKTFILLPRLALAVIFGIVIAEPLVLASFNEAVEQHVKEERAAAIRDLESRLTQCNPTGPQAVPPADPAACDGLIISVESTPGPLAQQLQAAEEAVAQLQQRVNEDTQRLAQLNELARLECNGTPGAGLTGIVGEGPNCARLRSEADTFAATSQIAVNNAALIDLRQEVLRLGAELESTAGTYEQQVDAGIDEKVSELAAPDAAIGLLERFDALDRLIQVSPFLWAARWFITLMFVTIDALPVIVKFFGGSTQYDRLLAARLAASRNVTERVWEADEMERSTDHIVRAYAARSRVASEKAEVDAGERLKAADRRARLDAEIDRRTRILAAQTAREPARP